MGNSPIEPLLVFCSYSHRDHQFRLELEAQVSPLVRQKLITFWSDRRIVPGDAWEQAIDEKLETADIIVLLISAYFIQSDYCYTSELQRALELDRGGLARVVPVFVRPCEWEGLDFAYLQGLPADGKPISTHQDPEEVWTEVVRGIKGIALGMQGKRRTRAVATAPVQSAPHIRYDPGAYLRSLVAWHRTAFAHTPEISLNATTELKVRPVGDALADWLGPWGRRLVVLSGEPGSGKTYTLRSLAARLADRCLAGATKTVCIFVPANRLMIGNPVEAIRDAVPEAADLLDQIRDSGSGVILIDALDELPAVMRTSLSGFVGALVSEIPKTIKIGLSCRASLRDVVVDAINATHDPPTTLEIQDLSDAQVRRMLEKSSLASATIPPHLRQPFVLRLMELQSTHSSIRVATGLLDLYDQALDTIIAGELGSSVELQAIVPADVSSLLTEAARQMLGVGSVPLDLLRPARISEPERAALLNSLIGTGLLALDARDRLTFGHESVFDYFFARVLEQELSEWDASHLSRSNLIYDYHVNRFLVPMLLRRPRRAPNAAAQQIRIQLSTPGRSEPIATSQPVTRAQFHTFMAETGWRKATGFGYWNIFEAPDGTQATSGKVLFDGQTATGAPMRAEEPVSGVSWYDAQQFAWWLGGSLPSDRETLAEIPGMLQWTSQWHDETKALMRLVHGGVNATSAANPDVRSSQIGFCVVLTPELRDPSKGVPG